MLDNEASPIVVFPLNMMSELIEIELFAALVIEIIGEFMVEPSDRVIPLAVMKQFCGITRAVPFAPVVPVIPVVPVTPIAPVTPVVPVVPWRP